MLTHNCEFWEEKSELWGKNLQLWEKKIRTEIKKSQLTFLFLLQNRITICKLWI